MINESLFLRNMAQGSGGVIYTNEYQTNYTIRHSIFQSNSASDGGVMHIQSDRLSNIDIDAGTYMGNHATGMGGVFYTRGGSLAIATKSTFSGNTAAGSGDVISTCFSSIILNASAYGLEIQLDPQNPQYCFAYDEDVTSGSGITPHTSTTETIMNTSTHPEITTHSVSEATTRPTTASSSTEAMTSSPGTPIITATQEEVTSSATTFHSNTEDSSTTKDNGGTDIPTSSTTESSTKNPFRTTTSRTDQGGAGVEGTVIYVSLAIGLISLIVGVTGCVTMLLLFCKIWKKMNSERSYRPVERRISFEEDEHTFDIDMDDSPSHVQVEESRLIPA